MNSRLPFSIVMKELHMYRYLNNIHVNVHVYGLYVYSSQLHDPFPPSSPEQFSSVYQNVIINPPPGIT